MNARDQYIVKAVGYGRCAEAGGLKKVNAAYFRVKKALARLRLDPDRGESILTELLDHPDAWLRSLAATHLLPLRADLASPVLEVLASGTSGVLRLTAEMALKEWRAGRLKVP
jgi:hypothetical protein